MKIQTTLPLQELVIKQTGDKPIHLSTVFTPDSLPYLGIEAIEKGEIKQYADWYSTIHSTEQDIFVVRTGGRNGLILKGKIGAVGSTVHCLTPIWIDSDYLYYFLKLNEFKNSGERDLLSTFWNIQVPIIPLSQQKKTSDDIKKALSIFDKQSRDAELKLITSLKSLVNITSETLDNIQGLDDFKKAVLDLAISGQLTENWRDKNLSTRDFGISEQPIGWRILQIGNFAECSRGRFTARPRNNPIYFKNGIYPFIQINDIPNDGGEIIKHKQVLNEEGISVSKSFAKDTVVIAIVGSTIGNTGILTYETYFPDSIVGMDTGSVISNKYLELYLRREKNKLRVISYSSGGQPNLRLEILKEFNIPVPPVEEQIEIINIVDKIFSIADSIDKSYYEEKSQQIELQKAILASFFENLPSYDKSETILSQIESAKIAALSNISNLRKKQKLFRETLFKFGYMKKQDKDIAKKIIKEIILQEYPETEIFTSKEIEDIQEKTKLRSGDYDYDNFSTIFIEMAQDALEGEELPFFISINHEDKLAYKIRKNETTLS